MENEPELVPRQSLLLLVWARCFQAFGLLPRELKIRAHTELQKNQDIYSL